MLSLGQFVAFFALIFAISGQLLNLDQTDQKCLEINENLKNQESTLASSMTAEINELKAILSSTASIPKLQASVQDLIDQYSLMSTLDNFGKYENMSTCNDLNQKITTLEMDIARYASIQMQASLNASYILTSANTLNYYFLINRGTVSSSLNLPTRYQKAVSIYQNYVSYITSLAVSRSTIAGIWANLKVYRRSYCICSTTLNSAGQQAASTIVTNMARIESTLLRDQSSVISAANDAKSKISVSSPLTSNPTLVDLTAKISSQLTKTLALNDYTNNITNSITSCADVQAQSGFVRSKYYSYIGIYGNTGSSYAYYVAYLSGFNATYTAFASTFNSAQKTAFVDVINAVTRLVNFYRVYYQDLAAGIARSAGILGEVLVIGNSYCACNSSSSGMTTSSGVSTSMASTTLASTTLASTTSASTTLASTTLASTTLATSTPTTLSSTTLASTTLASTTLASTTSASTTSASTTLASTTSASTTLASTTSASTTLASTTLATATPTTLSSTTLASSTLASTTLSSTTLASTTPTTTTTAPPPLYPCGTFFHYNPLTDKNGPAIRGFSAGTYYDGTQAYVGFMTGSSVCSNQTPLPARIDIVAGRASQACSPPIIYDSLTAYYLVNDSRYYWVNTTVAAQTSIADAVILKGNTYRMMIGRVKRENYTQIAKVHIDVGGFGAWFYDPITGTETGPLQNGYEVLACRSSDPYLITPSEPPCGTFIHYDPINDINGPVARGYSAGPNLDGQPVWVGSMHGYFLKCADQVPVPARIDVNPGTAMAYSPCAPIMNDAATAAYIHQNAGYNWVATNTTVQNSISNAVILKGNTFRFMVGRYKKDNWTSICKVHIDVGGFGCWYHDPATGLEVGPLTSGYEVLTCN